MPQPTATRTDVAIVLDRAYDDCRDDLARCIADDYAMYSEITLEGVRYAARKVTEARRAIRWFESEYNMVPRDMYAVQRMYRTMRQNAQHNV